MHLRVVPVTPSRQNCSVLGCEKTRAAAVVDPGGELERVLAVVQEERLQLEKILLTHAHLDHAAAAAQLARCFGLPIEGPHEADRFFIVRLPQDAAKFGLGPTEMFEPMRWLLD